MEVAEYLKKITSAHCNQPKYVEWVEVLLKMWREIGEVFESIPLHFSIDNAKGKQLDLIGGMFGVGRLLPYTADQGPLNDEDFREYIRAQILRSGWDGHNGSLYALWQSIYPEFTLQFADHMDMNVTVEIRGNMSPALTEMIQTGMILPVPMGVGVTYTIIAFEIPETKIYAGTGLYGAGEIGIDKQVN